MGNKILMIDDDPDFVESVKTLLESKGYNVSTSLKGEEGFEKAKEVKPDLMLLDVMMPNADGFDIARHLHDEEITRDIPIIIISGIRKKMNLSFGFEPDATWLPVKAVLEKPVKPEILIKAVEEHIKK